MNHIFAEIGSIIVVATICAAGARLLKQPPLFGYIVAGIILGPIGAHYIQNIELLDGMRQIGIALLLFLIGLELDWSKAKHQIRVAATLGLLQIIGSFVVGAGLALFMHQSLVTGVYLGLALAFSSTVIVVKLLSESHDLHSLHGRLSLGILLIQDILAIVALVIVSGLSQSNGVGLGAELLLLLIKSAALLIITYVCAQYILPHLFRRFARSSELLFLASVAWCFIFALVMSRFDFPIEIGAFLAGLSLAALPYGLDILSRLRSLRDFFVILLFVGLGTTLQLPTNAYLALTVCLVILTICIKPILSYVILILHGYRSRTAFFTALSQGQLSEFSLIIAATGLARGHINSSLASSLIFTTVFSILISTFLYVHRNGFYRLLRPFLLHTERHHNHESLTTGGEKLNEHIIIFGYHRMGYHILKKLRSIKNEVVVVDFNPEIIRKLQAEDIKCLYGDVEDEEIFTHLQASHASLVVSTIPHREQTLFLITAMKKVNKKARLIVTTHSIDDALLYYKLGVDYVILPHLLGGEYVADLITKYQEHSLTHFIEAHKEELKLLKTKKHALYFD